MQLQELEADGTKYFSSYDGTNKGFFKLADNEEWQPFKPFEQLPNIDFSDRNTRLIDLDGDGRAEILFIDDNVFTWYPSLGEKGFDASRKIVLDFDEEKAPRVIFNNQEQSIFLADMNGDGLTDIVRITNGSVSYWPNLGHGKFGPKITMDNGPVFTSSDQFNSSNIKLADIDGSGTTDIIYQEKNKISIWLNQSGNGFQSAPEVLDYFPASDNFTQIAVVDFLGQGTSSIVWSSNLPNNQQLPLRYIDLMNGKKPHLMIAFKDNMGKETEYEYTPSTYYYLKDKNEGNPWITKLPFPVHCLSKVTVYDRIMKTRLATEYSYHHGYYDHKEKEFRGFGRVDQKDAEEIPHFVKESNGAGNNIEEQNLHQSPVLTKTWFHTGCFFDKQKIINHFAGEYSQNPFHVENLLEEPELPADLSADEWREALRSCKGIMLRKEVYALDNSDLSSIPYSVEQQNCLVKMLQPRETNQYACFHTTKSETISYNYERNLEDPRIAHTFVLETDDFANIKKSVSLVYARKSPAPGNPPLPAEQLKK